ncbi:MAG: PTS glucose transporter subunit IIA, partial [Liquorilactobacillus ghanensis]|uniref:PTS glucose transporter subunit IIA n=1 Tax=Liquorilactobacillus ghanensis TaxID=399370 RepID=UPI0039E8F81E
IVIDNVKLNLKYFETLFKKQQHVNAGDKLVSFDLDKIKAAGYDTTIMLVVTNSKNYEVNVTTETAAADNWLLKLKPE